MNKKQTNEIKILTSFYESPYKYINCKRMSAGFVTIPMKLYVKNLKIQGKIWWIYNVK